MAPKDAPWIAWVILALASAGIIAAIVLQFTGCASPELHSYNPSAIATCPTKDWDKCRDQRR